MKCPRCEYQQPKTDRCIACGYEFPGAGSLDAPPEALQTDPHARFNDQVPQDYDDPTPVETPPAIREVIQRSGETDSPYNTPIRPSLRIVRTLAGLFGAGLGAWLFVVGQELTLAPHQMFVLIIYGCISIFWIVSAPIRVSVRQFAVEMLILVAATLFLRVSVPEAFELGRLTDTVTGPKGGGFTHNEKNRAQLNHAEAFVMKGYSLLDGGYALLEGDPEAWNWDRWSLHCEEAKKDYRLMDSGTKEKFLDAHIQLTLAQNRMARYVRLERVETRQQAEDALGRFSEALEQVAPTEARDERDE